MLSFTICFHLFTIDAAGFSSFEEFSFPYGGGLDVCTFITMQILLSFSLSNVMITAFKILYIYIYYINKHIFSEKNVKLIIRIFLYLQM